MSSVSSTPATGSVNFEDDVQDVVESIEVIDLTSSPNEDDQREESFHETLSFADLPTTLEEFYESIDNKHRPDFMQIFGHKLRSLRAEEVAIHTMLRDQEANVTRMAILLEKSKTTLREAQYDSSTVATDMQRIADAEKDLVHDRRILDHVRSWKSYLSDFVVCTSELYYLWERIWDWAEGRIVLAGRDSDEEDDDVDADPEIYNAQSVSEAERLLQLLRELEVRLRLCRDGSQSHGKKVMELIHEREDDE